MEVLPEPALFTIMLSLNHDDLIAFHESNSNKMVRNIYNDEYFWKLKLAQDYDYVPENKYKMVYKLISNDGTKLDLLCKMDKLHSLCTKGFWIAKINHDFYPLYFNDLVIKNNLYTSMQRTALLVQKFIDKSKQINSYISVTVNSIHQSLTQKDVDEIMGEKLPIYKGLSDAVTYALNLDWNNNTISYIVIDFDNDKDYQHQITSTPTMMYNILFKIIYYHPDVEIITNESEDFFPNQGNLMANINI
jgi:hypothetical protein